MTELLVQVKNSAADLWATSSCVWRCLHGHQ